MNPLNLGAIRVGEGADLVLVAGPCVVEDEPTMRMTARALVEICGERGVPLVFKSSFEKDNRTRPESPRGPGMAAGLALLGGLAREFGFPVTSDVHRPDQAAEAARVLDLVQVPALLCRQTSLLEAVGGAGAPVNIKKGQFMTALALAGSVDKVRGAGEARVMVTERGASWGPDRLVVDFAGLPALQALGCPVVLDAGHAAPGREAIPVLARCGVAAGVDALFVECHPDPGRAHSDGARMLSLTAMDRLLGELTPLARAVRGEA